jgi:hypothetical protein
MGLDLLIRPTPFQISKSNYSLAYRLLTCPLPSPVLEGGITSFWDVIAQVHATASNTGLVDAAEVAQLYVGIPGGPVKQLRGFSTRWACRWEVMLLLNLISQEGT